MENELVAAVASLGDRSEQFRKQVDRMRAFKERMREAGVEVRSNKFLISLTDGLSPAPRKSFTLQSK